MERSDANAQAYRSNVTAKQLLSGMITPPDWASTLTRTLESCTGMPGNRQWVQEFHDSHRESTYMFEGVSSPRGDAGASSYSSFTSSPTSSTGNNHNNDGYGNASSNINSNSNNNNTTLKKKSRPSLSFGRRKSSVAGYDSEFHDPSRAPPPLDDEFGDGDLTRGWDKPSPRLGRVLNPSTGYFETKFETDYVSEAQLKRHPRLSVNPSAAAAAAAATATGDKEKNYRHSEETYQAGSPFNSLPPFNYAQSNLSRSGSDVASHRRAFSSYTPSTSSRGNDNVNPFASEHEDDEWDLDGPSSSSYRKKTSSVLKLAPKPELTKPLLPHEGVARAIALYNFDAVQVCIFSGFLKLFGS